MAVNWVSLTRSPFFGSGVLPLSPAAPVVNDVHL